MGVTAARLYGSVVAGSPARLAISCLMLASAGAVIAPEYAGPASAQIGQANPSAVAGRSVDDSDFPLAPPELGSPRQTLSSLQHYAQQATDDFVKAFALSKSSGQILDTPEITALKQKALANLRRASETLDLSDAPPAAKLNVGVSSALLLKEVLDRIPVPDPADIPGLESVQAGEVPAGWRLPGTEIYMKRSEDADGSPVFLFSAETVRNLWSYYDRVDELPSREGDDIDFYVSFKTAPGLWLPISFYRVVLDLPPALRSIYWQQAAWKWIAFGALTLVLVAVLILLTWRRAGDAQAISPKRQVMRWLVTPLVLIGVLVGYRELVTNVINLSGDVLFSIELSVKILITLLGAWVTVLAFTLLGEILLATPRINRESLDGSMVRLTLKVLGIAAAAYIVTIGATQIGIPVYGIVAGIGIGGIAIALAIRPTLENLIGGIILYMDRPVRIGDFCKFGDMLGTVETIGLRSTKIRALDRTLITIQNAEFVQLRLVNFTRRDSNLFNPTIGLRYETTAEQLEAIIEQTRDMLTAHPLVKAETVRVTFLRYGTYSLDVELWAYAIPTQWAEFLAVQEELLVKFRKIVEANDSGFAFPSQTTYLVADAPENSQESAVAHESPEHHVRSVKRPNV